MTDLDFLAAEYPHEPTEDDGLELQAEVRSFPSEAAAIAWCREDPARRRYRGAQRRLPFGVETASEASPP